MSNPKVLNELSEKDIESLKWELAPCEIQNIIVDVSRKVIVPLSQINLNEVTSWQGAFSIEIGSTGQRTFFILQYKYALKLFKYLSKHHIYEVIPENRPCHLYFDIEFLFVEHPEYDGDKLICDLVSLVGERLFQKFGQKNYELIDLEATTPKKFSRHLIFHSDSFMFRNYKHAGYFVKTEILTNPVYSQIVDEAVYSKNRSFRCIWCTKFANGKLYPLTPKDKTNTTPALSSLSYFLKSLVAYKPQDSIRLLGYVNLVGQTSKTLTLSKNNAKENINPNLVASLSKDESWNKTIENFALQKFAPQGYISKSGYSPEFDTMSMIVEGCKYCHRIGREHKSNHIYLICNLSKGVITQRCFDPDCRGYESPPVEIPPNILQILREKYIPAQYNPERIQYKPISAKNEKSKLDLLNQIILENSSPLINVD